MMRSDLVDTTFDKTQVVKITPALPGPPPAAANPRMAYPVTLTIVLDARHLAFLMSPPVPAEMASAAGGGPGGGRMGRRSGHGGDGRWHGVAADAAWEPWAELPGRQSPIRLTGRE